MCVHIYIYIYIYICPPEAPIDIALTVPQLERVGMAGILMRLAQRRHHLLAVRMHKYIYIYIYICICTYGVYIYIYIFYVIYISIYLSIFLHIYTYIYIYIGSGGDLLISLPSEGKNNIYIYIYIGYASGWATRATACCSTGRARRSVTLADRPYSNITLIVLYYIMS